VSVQKIWQAIKLFCKSLKGLTKSGEKYQTLINESSDPIFSFFPDGRYAYVNKAFADELGLEQDSVIGKKIWDIFSKNEADKRFGVVKQVFGSGEVRTVEVFIPEKEGGKYYLTTIKPIKRDDGKVKSVLCISKNITNLKQAEERLRQNNVRHVAMMNNIGDVVCIIGIDGTMKYRSPNIEKIFGWKPEDLIGTNGWNNVHPDDTDRILEKYVELFKKDNSVVTVECRCKCKDGTFKWIELTAINCINDESICGVLLNYHDITVRRRLEEKLRTSIKEYQTTIDGLLAGVIVHDTDTRILVNNSEACNILGLSTEQLTGKESIDTMCNFVDKDMYPIRVKDYPVNKVISTKKSIKNYLLGVIRGDRGYITWVNVNAMPIFTEEGDLEKVVINFIDVTEQKRARDEKEKIARIESLGVLASGIAHDFNNLLLGIMGNTSMAIDEKDNSIREELLQESIRATKRATGLSNQLLTFSKGGIMSTNVSSIAKIVNESATFVLGKNTKCRCEISLDNDLWLAKVDANQIFQVIQNLVINAVQSMPGGGLVHVCGKNVENPECIGLGSFVLISVRDEGIGIPEKYLSKIFDPYFTTKNKQGGGSGLGLAVSYSIIKKHNGHIFAESESGVGASFHVFLPAVKKKLQVEKNKESDVALRSLKVLVMDDEEMLRNMLDSMLKRLGHQVELVAHGQEAIEKYVVAKESPIPFDLVILDLTIPGGMGGVETLAHLRKIDPEVVALISSGFSHDFPEGFAATLQKPYTKKSLQKVLMEMFGN